MTNQQKELSPRVTAVADAIQEAFAQREEITGKPAPLLMRGEDKETGELSVIIQQGDDPADALILSDKGLAGMDEGSMVLPWTEHQGEAFFAAVIVMFTCEEEILRPPVCETCAEASQ